MKNKQTILIVDDVSENIDVLTLLLKEHDLVTALDGNTAIEILKDEKIDLILLDIMMPELDGFEVCSILKKNPETMYIPIIFLSAKDNSEDIQQGFELGGVDYITKPFNPNELLSRVHTHLKLRAYEKDLELQVKEAIKRNKQKEQMIHQNSKQAALGELLMHISHQWKQPLASLNSINLLNLTKIEMGKKLTQLDIKHSIEKSEELIQYMSTTMNTFQNFYTPSYINELFFLKDCVLDVISIIEATFNFENIKIFIDSNETIKTDANINEISQVIFSILNNAKDIFKLRKVKNPEIHIEISNQKFSIYDNAGGIEKEEMMKSIFLPFVTQTNGSGIGLYLSKNIVEKNNAVISVENHKDGANFTVEFITWIKE